MNRIQRTAALAMFGAGMLGGRPVRQITDGNRTFKTRPAPERLAAAEAKRARKNAKRAGELNS